ncbi:ABC transporter ATP-binding protein [[Eubacterium] cellulosolvens]|nr:ABC transporter ATP-binding protein [Candidatus Bathyarchaeota archaeon]
MNKDNTRTAVSVRDLHKTFESGYSETQLFSGLNFDINEGDFVAITGSSGTGKTTLLNLIAGLDKPTKGTITVLGKELSLLNDRELTALRADSIGILFQTFGLLTDLNVKENIKVTQMISGKNNSSRERYSDELLEFFGLNNKAFFNPSSLSVGEAKKAGIARAISTGPQILLLDEPTGNLDPQSVNVLLPILRGLRHIYRKTIIMTTNTPRAAKIANREIHIEKPKIIPIM